MTSTPGGSSLMDWRVKRLPNLKLPSKVQLSQQRCPFILEPEDRDSVPAAWTENLQFLVMGQDNAPWTGYYATFNRVKMAVSNFLGIWFEIRRHNGAFEAFRVAHSALQLKSHPLPGTNIVALMESSEPLSTTCPMSHAESYVSEPEEIEPMPYVGKGKETELEALLRRSKSSRTAQGREKAS